MASGEVVALVGHLAWPVVLLVCVLMVRREIRAIGARLAAHGREETLSDIPDDLLDKIIAGFASEDPDREAAAAGRQVDGRRGVRSRRSAASPDQGRV